MKTTGGAFANKGNEIFNSLPREEYLKSEASSGGLTALYGEVTASSSLVTFVFFMKTIYSSLEIILITGRFGKCEHHHFGSRTSRSA